MRLVSQGAQYAISAIIAISKHEDDVISASVLSRHLNCPTAYLSQILSKLKAPGILGSQRGLNGGVFLARPVHKISVYDVISAIDGEAFFTTCFMGIDGCGKIEPCPFHGFWSMYREQIKEWLQETSFAQAEELMSNAWFEERLTFASNNGAA